MYNKLKENVPIEHAYAIEDYYDTTNYEAVARVRKMKELGLLNEYEIPQYIDENNREVVAFIEQMMRKYDINE